MQWYTILAAMASGNRKFGLAEGMHDVKVEMDETENLLGIELREKPPPPPIPQRTVPAPKLKLNHKTLNMDLADSNGKKKNEDMLLSAVQSGDLKSTEEILTKDASDINRTYGLLRVTVLHMASYLHPDLVPVLLNHGADVKMIDRLGRTALHLACTAGNDTCVASLLRAGSEVNTQVQLSNQTESPHNLAQQPNWRLRSKGGTKLKQVRKPRAEDATPTPTPLAEPKFCSVGNELPVPECWGRTPLHQAVKAGQPACVRLLLLAGAKVDKKDEKELVPLLLAGAGVSPEDSDAISRYEDIVLQLVVAGADVNVYNPDTGSSALHHAAARCSLAATRLLVEKGADVTRRGATGDTPLHEAAHSGADMVLAELLAAPEGPLLVNKPDHVGCTPLHKAAFSGARECLALLLRHGGDLAAMSHSKTTVLDAVFMYIPRPAHFLSSVLDSCVQTNNASVLDRSFKVTLDFGVLAPHGPVQQTAVMRGILSAPTGPGHNLLMRHPLLETFLRLKWQRLRFFFFTLLSVYICFLLSLSGYVIVIHLHGVSISYNVKLILQILLICFSSLLLIHVFTQAILLPAYYIKSIETWFIALCSTLSLVLVAFTHINSKENTIEPEKWVQHLTSFTTLIAWTELMLFTGRFPKWGNYALMFYTVLRNVLRVLLTFVCIVFGFSLSFFVQFDKNPIFNNPWKAFVKTMVMMTGEFEYQDLFKENKTDGIFDMHEHTERLPITSRIIFLTFVILASIVMMNLMVGLAVSDIQGIQAEGHLRRLLKQAEFVDHLESIMSHRFFNKLFPRCLLSLLSKRKSIVTILTLQPSAVERRKRRPHNLPHRLLEACVELAVRRRAMSTLKNNDDLWGEFSNTGQRISWYVDQSDGTKNNINSNNINNQSLNSPLSIDELLLRVSTDLRVIKEILGGPNNNESRPNSRQASPITMRSNLLRVPRGNSQHNSIMDVVSELQGAHCMLRRLGRTSRSEWLDL